MASRYESVRRQLDALLGVDRDKPLGAKAAGRSHQTNDVDFEDPKLCKHYLLGLCLSTLSIKRRGGFLTCTKVHSDEAVTRLGDLLAEGHPPPGYARWQRDLAESCRSVVDEEDRRILGVARRLKDSYGFEEPASSIIVKDLSVLQELGILVNGVISADAQLRDVDDDMEDVINANSQNQTTDSAGKGGAEVEIKILGVASHSPDAKTPLDKPSGNTAPTGKSAKGEDVLPDPLSAKEEQGRGQTAEALSAKEEALPVKGEETLTNDPRKEIGNGRATGPSGLLLNREYKQRVCGQCGGLISLHDAETRLASHYAGKQHVSLVSLREKLREVEDAVRGRGPNALGSRGALGHRQSATPRGSRYEAQHGGRAWGRGRSRSRSPKPARRSSRSRSRSRSPRHRDGHGDRRRHRSRSPDRFQHRRFNGRDDRHGGGFKRPRAGASPPRRGFRGPGR